MARTRPPSTEIVSGQRTDRYCEQRGVRVAQHAFAVTSSECVEEAVAPVGGHHDQPCAGLRRGINNAFDDIARPSDFLPFPSGHIRRLDSRHCIWLAHME